MERGALDMGGLSFQTMRPRGEPARFGVIRRFEQLDSTNRVLLELAGEGAAEGVVVVADHQTEGRGRRGRTWSAPPGSALLASVLLRPPVAPGDAHIVAMAVALAATDACLDAVGMRPRLKWPNDLVAPHGEEKLAGVLGELVVVGGRLVAMVVGMGLNVGRAAATVAGAVSLEDLARLPVDRDVLLASWLGHLEVRYAQVLGPHGPHRVLASYRRHCATLGRHVRIELDHGSFQGRAADVTEAGHLVVDTDAGRREVTAADVVHLRPGP